jgi:Protein of unknown function (DUF2934)
VEQKMSTTKIKNEGIANTKKSNKVKYLPDLSARIAKIAYYKANSRGFVPGQVLDDWIAAEQKFKL